MAGHKQAGRPLTASAKKNKARHISVETWAMWKDDVYKRYIISDQSLEKIMHDYAQLYDFHGTKKQWKDQLTRWHFRKRLNKEDAAYILHLLEEAENQGLRRQVLFNQIERTIGDIDQYIRKSDLVESREQLLLYLDLEDPSPYITCIDDGGEQTVPQASPDVHPRAHAPENHYQRTPNSKGIQNWQPAEPARVLEEQPMNALHNVANLGHLPSFRGEEDHVVRPLLHQAGTAMDRQSSGSSTGFEEVASLQSVESLSSYASAELKPSPPDSAAQYNLTPYQVAVSDFDVHAPNSSSRGTTVCPPQDVLPNAMTHQIDPRMMNDLLSNSPIQTHLSPQALSSRINSMFCKIDAIGSDGEARQRVAVFLRHCCAAPIYGGQQYQQDSWLSISRAVETFKEIMRKNPWDTLTTLNHMLALLTQYGHRIAIDNILQKVKEAVSDFKERNEYSMFTSVVQSVVNFMTTIPEVGTKPDYDVEELSLMEQRARLCFSDRQEFQLSAAYVHAWGLLEMKHSAEALRKLSDLRPACEEIFGYGQCQTISWIATLARAYAGNGQNRMAANTYRDVAGRISQYFNEWHPQYWDSRYRQACFDMKVIDDCQDDRQQRQGWLNVAHSLRDTLMWRATHLGPVNPHSLQNLKAFRIVLKKLKKIDDSATFEQIVNVDLSQ